MTIFGIDIASWQKGLNLDRVAAEGFSYVIAKATESNNYKNPEYGAQKDGARKNGLLFGAYHYLRADVSARSQVDNYASLEPDKSIPVMLDHEAGSGDIRVLRAVHDEFVSRGYRVNLTYLPNWYWAGTMGRPDLTGLPPLMSSNYGNERAGYASAIYPGDSNVGWNGYGGIDVAVFQFTQKASVAGQSIDANAFRGTPDQLAALFGAPPKENPVASVPEELLAQETGSTRPGEYPGWPARRHGVELDKQPRFTQTDYARELDRELNSQFDVKNAPLGDTGTLVGQVLSTRRELREVKAQNAEILELLKTLKKEG